MLTDWEAVCEAILERDRGVEILLGMCRDESEEVVHRGLVCVLNLVNAEGETGNEGVRAVREHGGKEVLGQTLGPERSKEVLGLGVEILRKIS